MEAMDAESEREASRQDHLNWLRAQRSDFEDHQARSSSSVGPLAAEMDFAVGGEQLDDEVPVYRSLAFSGPSQPASIEYEEEPVYRSMDLGKMADNLPSPDLSVDASWVAGKRPPLLRRQNAFRVKGDDPSWLGLLGQDAQPSGQ